MTPAEWRRRLGPTAWVVFEEVSAVADAGGVASVNARQLAETLGLGKDTAARALVRLCECGLLSRVRQSRTRQGRFGSGEYMLRLGAVSESPCPVPADTVTQNVVSTRLRPPAPPAHVQQLTLLPVDTTTTGTNVVNASADSISTNGHILPHATPARHAASPLSAFAPILQRPTSCSPDPGQQLHELASSMRPGWSPAEQEQERDAGSC